MRYLKYAAILGVLVAMAGATAGTASAQVRVGVGFGVGPAFIGPPVCAYGYYPYAPYACAPYGYYGPTWFLNGAFIGAGPWFHGYRGGPVFVGHGFRGDRDFRGGRDFRGDRGFRGGRDGRDARGFRGGNDFQRRGGESRGSGFHGGRR
jgi:hypothetical protein